MKGRVACLVVCISLAVALSAAAQEPQDAEQAPEKNVAGQGFRYAEIEIDGLIWESLPDLYLLEPDVALLHEIIERIDRARQDRTVRGVVIKLGRVGTGWAKAQEIRRALLDCREGGKEVVCYMERSGGNLEYYVACAADRVVMPPTAVLFLVGLRAEVMFFKGLLDTIGVKGDLLQVGMSKGAAEPFTRTTASESFRESIEALLDDYYRQLLDGVAAGRGMEVDAVSELVDRGPFTARRAVEAGLVDEVRFYDELIGEMKRHPAGPFVLAKDYGAKQGKPPGAGVMGPQQLLGMLFGVRGKRPTDAAARGPAIAVIYAVGPIVMEDTEEFLFGESVVSAPRMIKTIRQAREQGSTKAIVLRVDSPGGSAEASDVIWHELRLTDEVKPVIVSLSDVAASGGYYIATGGRKIFADPGTITGSIGVVGGKLVLKGLFEKIGLSVDVFQRGRNAGLLSSVEEFSDSQRERMRELLLQTYEVFLQRIAVSRGQSLEELRKVAQGQSVTGLQAQRQGLVDEIGGLSDALAEARRAAGIPPEAKVRILRMPKPRSLFEVILWGDVKGSRMPRSLRLAAALPPELRAVRSYLWALWCLEADHMAALMPVSITVK